VLFYGLRLMVNSVRHDPTLRCGVQTWPQGQRQDPDLEYCPLKTQKRDTKYKNSGVFNQA